jgi:ribosomal protein L39E
MRTCALSMAKIRNNTKYATFFIVSPTPKCPRPETGGARGTRAVPSVSLVCMCERAKRRLAHAHKRHASVPAWNQEPKGRGLGAQNTEYRLHIRRIKSRSVLTRRSRCYASFPPRSSLRLFIHPNLLPSSDILGAGALFLNEQ